ncbi:hypothetical protein HZ326_22773 [Fusarium oxysporum f. sp. albedinis]|nr:hypothetical protein HZ326_22773 [Fusarium oxysporum f. sp. albedinis]
MTRNYPFRNALASLRYQLTCPSLSPHSSEPDSPELEDSECYHHICFSMTRLLVHHYSYQFHFVRSGRNL